MIDSEKLSSFLNTILDEGIQDDMLSLIYQANKTTFVAVKTPMCMTEINQNF